MTTIDIIILIIIGAGVVAGFMKGFIRQLASILGLVVGLLAAKALYATLAEKLCPAVTDSMTVAQVLAYCHLDRCSADIHVSGVLADESDGSHLTGVAEPLAGKWIGSTQISVVNEPCDLCDRVYR